MGYIPRPSDESCPRCGSSEDVTVFRKEEGSGVKLNYTCDGCPHEWSEWERQADDD